MLSHTANIDSHSESTKPSNNTKLKDCFILHQRLPRLWATNTSDLPPTKRITRVFTSVYAQDLTHFLSVSSRSVTSKLSLSFSDSISSLRRESVNRWMSRLTDEAYLLTALHAWADPMCRSFCRSHRFFCLDRRDRREDDVSVISWGNWNIKVNVGDTSVRPIWVSNGFGSFALLSLNRIIFLLFYYRWFIFMVKNKPLHLNWHSGLIKVYSTKRNPQRAWRFAFIHSTES